MITEVKMFGCVCDNCGEKWKDEHSGFVGFTKEWDMDLNVQSSDWHTEVSTGSRDKHYCTDCFKGVDENDAPILAEVLQVN